MMGMRGWELLEQCPSVGDGRKGSRAPVCAVSWPGRREGGVCEHRCW